MIRIDGEIVFLVPFQEEHLTNPKYFQWVTDTKVMQFVGRDEYLKPIQFEKVREYVEDLWRNKCCFFFAIYHSKAHIFVGTAKINYLDESGRNSRTADIGIMIGERDYWGKGVATDALRTLCQYAFVVQDARKLTAGAMAANEGAISAFKKIGFVEEGRIRKKLLVSGKYMDHVLLGCFSDELIAFKRRTKSS